MNRERLEGLLLGAAVGDSLGLPREGLSPGRARRLFGEQLRHRLFFGRGLLSDDTEHLTMVAQAWLASDGDVDRFRRKLARGLRWWLIALPAGVGLGTARAVLKLWLGWSPRKSGVRSAGNGPSMRSGILGAIVPDEDRLREFVAASTRITHSDPRAERAALLVAVACRHGPVDLLPALRAALPDMDEELCGILETLERGQARGATAREFCGEIGIRAGISGYAYHTVPAAMFAWLRHPGDFRAALTEAISLGGDTDTVGAIAGALAGATVGASGIPEEWIDGIADCPRSTRWIRRLASRLDEGGRPLPLNRLLVLPRNLWFLAVVLFHGFRRLLPPY